MEKIIKHEAKKTDSLQAPAKHPPTPAKANTPKTSDKLSDSLAGQSADQTLGQTMQSETHSNQDLRSAESNRPDPTFTGSVPKISKKEYSKTRKTPRRGS